MRTNIVLDDELMAEAAKYTEAKTKKGIVEEALKFYVQVNRQTGVRKLRGIGWEGDLDEMRRKRDFI